ncbi:MAG: hypothetical protein HC875_15955 [Anaerolineales bacterium]|nr:hypothetical protein [Anaerolineales bacterium]
MATRFQFFPRYLGLALISGSILALQVTFTRIFSIMIWYHFTYLVVGVALLGGGAAGTYLAVRQWDTAVLSKRISKLTVGFSLSILLCLLAINLIQFDPLGGRAMLVSTLVGLAVYFSCLFTTFFVGGLTVAGVFSLWARQAHRLYFADLLGASLSTLAVVWIIQMFGGPATLVLIALLGLIASLLFQEGLSRGWRQAIALLGVGQVALFVIIAFIWPIQLPIPETKELPTLLRTVGIEEPEYTRWNPVGRVDVLPLYESGGPAAIVGGISSVYLENKEGSPPMGERVHFVTLDGTSMTALHEFDGDLTRFQFLDHAIISAPYLVSVEKPKVLNIGVGGGLDILLARYHQARQITAIEINSDVVNLLTGPYADFTGRLSDDPRTKIAVAEGRSFLTRDQEQYDIIQGIGLDNFAALSGGAYVLSESYIYTVDALELALNRLSPEGIFSWTRNVNERPREMLRLTGLAAEALRRQGVANPAQYIAIVSNEENYNATLLVSRSPFTLAAIEQLRQWVVMNKFHLLHDPFERLDTIYTDYLLAPDPRAFEAAYVFNIYPVTDDNPFFYNYFKWTDVRLSSGEYSGDVNNNFPVGNLILMAMLLFTTLTAMGFVIFPLLRYKREGLQTPHALPMLTYFCLLGLGYIFVEIILIQRFTLFIGYPTHAITTTIFSMLFFSALGSLVGQKICKTPQQLRWLLAILALLIFGYILGLPPIFRMLLPLSDPMRMLTSVILIAPLALLMGIPFPTGLRQLGEQAQTLVPWAWGMNGVFSVLGSALVILVSMQTNFTFALASGAGLYALAAVISVSLWQTKVVQTTPVPAAQNADRIPI